MNYFNTKLCIYVTVLFMVFAVLNSRVIVAVAHESNIGAETIVVSKVIAANSAHEGEQLALANVEQVGYGYEATRTMDESNDTDVDSQSIGEDSAVSMQDDIPKTGLNFLYLILIIVGITVILVGVGTIIKNRHK